VRAHGGNIADMQMLQFSETFLDVTSSIVQLLAAIIVGVGAVRAFYSIVLIRLFGKPTHQDFERTRLQFGSALVMALEFELGSDLLQTAIRPTWSHIGVVAAIVVLRSVLNYLLQRDISRAQEIIRKEAAQ